SNVSRRPACSARTASQSIGEPSSPGATCFRSKPMPTVTSPGSSASSVARLQTFSRNRIMAGLDTTYTPVLPPASAVSVAAGSQLSVRRVPGGRGFIVSSPIRGWRQLQPSLHQSRIDRVGELSLLQHALDVGAGEDAVLGAQFVDLAAGKREPSVDGYPADDNVEVHQVVDADLHVVSVAMKRELLADEVPRAQNVTGVG